MVQKTKTEKRDAESFPSVWMIFCFFIIATLFCTDIWTTLKILEFGGSELNPVMVDVTRDWFYHGAVKAALLGGICYVADEAESRIRNAGIVLCIAIIVMYSVVVLNNAAVLIGLVR